MTTRASASWTAPPSAPAREVLLPIDAVGTDPARFQPRDVPAGHEVDPKKVSQITQDYRPQEFDAILVVRDPADPGRYITVAGHHRRAAAIALDREGRFATPGEIPARVLDADISTAEGLRAAQDIANRSNTTVAGLTPLEIIRRVRALRERGQSRDEIAGEMRMLYGKSLDEYLWLSNLADRTLERSLLYPDLRGVAVEAGRAIQVHGINADQADQMVDRYLREATQQGWKPPPQPMLRKAIDDGFRRQAGRGDSGQQTGFGGGFEDAAIYNHALTAIMQHVRDANESESQRRKIKSQMTACENLAMRLGVDLSDIKAKVQSEIADQDARKRAASEAAFQAYQAEVFEENDDAAAQMPEEPERDNAPAPDMAENLFGEMQAMPTSDDDALDADAVYVSNTRPEPAAAQPQQMVSTINEAAEDGILRPDELADILPDIRDDASPDDCRAAMIAGVTATTAAERAAESAQDDKAQAEAELARLAAATGLPTPDLLPETANVVKLAPDGETLRTYRSQKVNVNPVSPTPDEDAVLLPTPPPPADSDRPDWDEDTEAAEDGYGEVAGEIPDGESVTLGTKLNPPLRRLPDIKPNTPRWNDLSDPERRAAVQEYRLLLARIAIAERRIAAAGVISDRAATVIANAQRCANAPGGAPHIAPLTLARPKDALRAMQQSRKAGSGVVTARIESYTRGRPAGAKGKPKHPFARPGDIPSWARR